MKARVGVFFILIQNIALREPSLQTGNLKQLLLQRQRERHKTIGFSEENNRPARTLIS